MGKGRAPCCDKSKVKRGPWSPAEDLRLITFIQKHGHENWRALPKQAGLLRCGKSCRLRWINYLRPDVKRGNFKKEEEDTIIKLHETLGNKWSKIASHLPGRTDNEIKNIWNTHLKKKMNKKADSDLSADESLTTSSPTSSNSCGRSKIKKKIKYQSDDEEGSVAKKPKESMSSSNSCENSNISSPEHHVQRDQLFEFIEPFFETNGIIHEVGKADVLEIPVDPDMDIWNLLDGLDSLQPSNDIGLQDFQLNQSPMIVETPLVLNEEAEIENTNWFHYLENELGLKNENQETMAQTENASFLSNYDRLLKPEAIQ